MSTGAQHPADTPATDAPAAGDQAIVNTRHAMTIANALLSAGVRQVVLSPGSRNTPLIFAFDALERAGRLQIHIAIDERVAAFIAVGCARATGEPVVLLCTSGSAAAHWTPALAEAQRSALPIIAVSTDRPHELHDRGAPQTMPQAHLFTPFVRQELALTAPHPNDEHRVDVAQKVLWIANLARRDRRPVHINVALREPLWTPACDAVLHELSTACPQARSLDPSVAPPQGFLDAMAPYFAQKGAIYVGPIDAGQHRDDEASQLRASIHALAEALDWPVFGDAVSPQRVHGDDEHLAADILFRDDELASPDELQTLLIIGPWPTSKPLGLWLQRHPQVRVVSWPGVIGPIDPWHRVELTVNGPIEALVNEAATHEQRRATTNVRRERWARQAHAIQSALEAFCDRHDLFEGAIARAVTRAVRAPATLHIGSSMPIRDVDTYGVGPRDGVRLCASRGVNGIDGNIATALGAALTRRTPAVLLLGDIAFRHDMGALAHAANTDAKLTVIVVDNSGGGIFRHLAVSSAEERFRRYFLTPQASDIAALAEGCGARVHIGGGASEIAAILANVQDRPGVDVVVLRVDGERQVAWRQNAVAAALQAAKAAT